MRLPPFNPYIAVVIGVASVSTSAVFVKLADQAPAAIIANYRLLFAVLLMAPFVLTKYRHELKLINQKDWILSILAGIFLAFHFILWFESLNYTSVASSVVLVTLQPIFAFLGTYFFFKERFSSGAVISMLIALIGSIIISWGDFKISGVALFGDILALLGAITVTAYFLLGQQVRRNLSLMTYTFVVYGVSSITLIVYNLLLSNAFFNYPADHWWIFLALAIIPTFLGHTLFNWALKWLSTATISMGIVFEPIGASILAYIILGENITAFQLLGGTIVLFGLFLFILSTNRKTKMTIAKKEQQD
ncbi:MULTISPECIES: DMT family transporter [Virgibacillus]|uniref:Carboxylate/amino acid/amine transporter n=2 Tax=Virgibacillus TaxID=84406 RepID=A0A024QEF0_9BACI|nr:MULTISPECIES: DMT family transporter [Virgibacillus]EQB38793.1 membrane protein [Virgibacillus sp. CM-4]MYL43853.1 EamA family transporter [Virgibacillus massiliensis]GGJ66133.1 membrane protein [Virgibacillus kapii]CDQ40918.1 carboxylate/amino acid/amine transporter [Virgibacillus massiliensis]